MAGDNNTLYEQVLGAEQSVIGSMLIGPKTVGLVLQPEDFSLEATRNLFRAFRKLYLENRIMDPVTVLAAIGPQDASMRSYVMELMDRTLTPANIAEYIEQVKRESLRLRLQNIGRELLERLSNPEDAMPLLMRGMELLSGQRQDDEADMERSILDFYEDLKHEPEYLPWGFPELDEGLYVERGDFVVLAGRPYHIVYNPPKVEGKDDVTGDPLIQRDDDKEDVVRHRLEVYHNQTEALVKFYGDLAKSGDKTAPQYRAISGLGTIDEITARVFDALK